MRYLNPPTDTSSTPRDSLSHSIDLLRVDAISQLDCARLSQSNTRDCPRCVGVPNWNFDCGVCRGSQVISEFPTLISCRVCSGSRDDCNDCGGVCFFSDFSSAIPFLDQAVILGDEDQLTTALQRLEHLLRGSLAPVWLRTDVKLRKRMKEASETLDLLILEREYRSFPTAQYGCGEEVVLDTKQTHSWFRLLNST